MPSFKVLLFVLEAVLHFVVFLAYFEKCVGELKR